MDFIKNEKENVMIFLLRDICWQHDTQVQGHKK